MRLWPDNPKDRIRSLVILIVLGCGLRLLLWLVSLGSTDVVRWELFATSLVDLGAPETYARFQDDLLSFNHPPLMAALAAWSLRISQAVGMSFGRVFKLLPMAADVATGVLLYRVWRGRSDVEAGLTAAAAYALAPSVIMISGYHGNTDAIYFFLVFAAAYLMEEKRAPLGAGLAMGAALNVKLIPVVTVLPLASRCLRLRDAARYAGGVAVGALPFLWAYLTFGPQGRRAFVQAIFAYRAVRENWGVELAVRVTRNMLDTVSEVPGYIVQIVGNYHETYGAELLLVASAAVASWHLARSRRDGRARFDSYTLVAAGYLLFLLFGSGFAVQYVGCVVAPLMATNIRRGLVVATVTGVFIAMVYAHFVVDWNPIYSEHGPMPIGLTPLSIAAWAALFWAGRDMLQTTTPRGSAVHDAHPEPGAMPRP